MKNNLLDASGLISAGHGKVVFIGGGVLAKQGGEIVGAIGVSGAAEADQDHACGVEATSQM
jgi:uncharacterized protein GlcG (DUF336 family)